MPTPMSYSDPCPVTTIALAQTDQQVFEAIPDGGGHLYHITQALGIPIYAESDRARISAVLQRLRGQGYVACEGEVWRRSFSAAPPPRLPRGACPACGKSVPLRRGGELRQHRVRHGICAGEGRTQEELS